MAKKATTTARSTGRKIAKKAKAKGPPARRDTRSATAATRSTKASKIRASRKAPAKKSASAKPARATSGKGATPAEIGRDLVTLVNLGKSDQAVAKWYHAQIESVEGDGQSWKGLKALRGKNEWWYSTNELHSCLAEGPFSGATGFAVRYTMAFTPKGGERIEMSEVGVYTVRNGKIVREEYMYAG